MILSIQSELSLFCISNIISILDHYSMVSIDISQELCCESEANASDSQHKLKDMFYVTTIETREHFFKVLVLFPYTIIIMMCLPSSITQWCVTRREMINTYF